MRPLLRGKEGTEAVAMVDGGVGLLAWDLIPKLWSCQRAGTEARVLRNHSNLLRLLAWECPERSLWEVLPTGVDTDLPSCDWDESLSGSSLPPVVPL